LDFKVSWCKKQDNPAQRHLAHVAIQVMATMAARALIIFLGCDFPQVRRHPQVASLCYRAKGLPINTEIYILGGRVWKRLRDAPQTIMLEVFETANQNWSYLFGHFSLNHPFWCPVSKEIAIVMGKHLLCHWRKLWTQQM